jgi:hypothetical protein
MVAVFHFAAADAGMVVGFTPPSQLPVPPQSEVQWIARSMRMNGAPMTLQSIQSRLSPDALFAYYEARTRDIGGNEYRRSASGEWQLLAIRSPRRYTTIQVRHTTGGSEGTITTSALPAPTITKTTSEFPRPPSARIVNFQEYDDAGIQSEHISLLSSRAVALEAWAFAEKLTRAGWKILRQQQMHQVSAGVAIETQRGTQHALLTLQPDHAQPALTAIVVVWRKS